MEMDRSKAGSANRVKIDCSCAAFGPLEVEFSLDEAIRIGDSIGIDWKKVDVEQFRMGLAVELEHGCREPQTNITCDNLNWTGKIALAHLEEVKDYYSRLKKVESKEEV